MTFRINGIELDFKNKTCKAPVVVRFGSGEIKTTPKAMSLVAKHGFYQQALIARHLAGDWGDVSDAQSRHNELALTNGSKVLAWYRLVEKIWLESIPYLQRKHLPTIWIETSSVNEVGIRAVTTIFCSEDW